MGRRVTGAPNCFATGSNSPSNPTASEQKMGHFHFLKATVCGPRVTWLRTKIVVERIRGKVP
jgi:hypothetical protein